MNENSFLIELEEALKGLPAEERKDILKDIREYFSDGREDGKEDGEIAASLGAPKVIAAELLEAYPLVRLSEEKDATQQVQTIKDDSFTKIDINAHHGSLYLSHSDDSETIIEIDGQPDKHTLTAEVIGDTLNIHVKNKSTWGFMLNFSKKAIQLKISVPKKLYESIHLKSNNGKIEAEKLIATSIHSQSDNGRIILTEIASSNLQVETDNGRIELVKVQSDQLKAKSDNGRILMNYVEADHIHAKTDNGRIELDQVTGNLIASTDNGRILLNTETLDQNIDFQTANGSIEINSSNMPMNASISAKTRHGRIDIFGENNSLSRFGKEEHQVKLKSSNGRITVR